MPGSTPLTSQLDWLISTTAMIVLFWSKATRDQLKSFGWGIGALHRFDASTKVPFPCLLPLSGPTGFLGAKDLSWAPRGVGTNRLHRRVRRSMCSPRRERRCSGNFENVWIPLAGVLGQTASSKINGE